MQGDVSLEQLERMTAGIDRALMADLRHLVNPKDGYVERTLGVSLMMSGLVMLMPNAAVGLNSLVYALTDAGTLVIEHCLRPRPMK